MGIRISKKDTQALQFKVEGLKKLVLWLGRKRHTCSIVWVERWLFLRFVDRLELLSITV
jgi:hypothetical protein